MKRGHEALTIVRKPKRDKKKIIIILLSIIFIVALGYLAYTKLYYKNCADKTCFETSLESCSKAKFISIKNTTFEYKILGKKDSQCQINVQLLAGDLTDQDSKLLEQKSMVCSLPINVIATPESDLTLCHGELKEGLQEIIIQKLQTYIVQNIGKVARA